MINEKIEINTEGVITIRNQDGLVAIVYNDITTRSQRFFSVKEMGTDDIKGMLERLNEKEVHEM